MKIYIIDTGTYLANGTVSPPNYIPIFLSIPNGVTPPAKMNR